MKNLYLKRLSRVTNGRFGMSMIMLVVMIAAIGICMVPITRWYMSITRDVDYLSEKLEMQSIIQDHWHQLNESSFDEFEEAIATSGNVFTEDVGDKWTVTTTFGPLGAYKNALCNEGATPDDEDRRCRKAHIEIKSKTEPENLSLVMATTTTRVASAGGGGEAIGTIVPRLNDNWKNPSEKKKYLFCDGSVFSATEFPKLYAVLGTNVLPDLREQYLKGSDIGNSVVGAGLPDVTGTFASTQMLGGCSEVYPYGGNPNAFYSGGNSGSGHAAQDTYSYYHINVIHFSAARSNPIYGNSETVTPPSVTVRYYIRAK